MQHSAEAIGVALSGGNKMKKHLKLLFLSIVIALAGSIGASSLGYIEQPLLEIVMDLLGIDADEDISKKDTSNK